MRAGRVAFGDENEIRDQDLDELVDIHRRIGDLLERLRDEPSA